MTNQLTLRQQVDFDAMDGTELLAYCGDSGMKWAEAFCHTAKKLGYSDMDEDWVFGWFANAIEHSRDVRTGNGPVVMPDGSAFFIAEVGETK